MDNIADQPNVSADEPTSGIENSGQVEALNNESQESMQIESLEHNANEINFVEESVAEVVVLSASQTEDTIPLDNESLITSNDLDIAVPGPSTSRTSQTETATSNVATETTASTSDASPMRPRIIRVIAHQSYSGSIEDGRINRRYVDLKYELIKKKVDFLRLKRERLMEEFDLRMKLIRTQLTFEEKKLLMFRKKYRR